MNSISLYSLDRHRFCTFTAYTRYSKTIFGKNFHVNYRGYHPDCIPEELEYIFIYNHPFKNDILSTKKIIKTQDGMENSFLNNEYYQPFC